MINTKKELNAYILIDWIMNRGVSRCLYMLDLSNYFIQIILCDF